MDETLIIMSDIEKNELLSSVDVLLKTHSSNFPINLNDYNVKNVSDKVARIIRSYISFINRKVWKKRSDKNFNRFAIFLARKILE